MRKTCLLLALLIVACRSDAQQRLGEDSLFKILVDSFPIQKVYLHTDRDRYMAGDTLWFKAYLRSMGYPGGGSTGLHVEIFDAGGGRVVSKVFPVLKGRISLGDVELPDSLSRGWYTLRAYTEWMSNFDPSLFYVHSFPIYAGPASKGPERARQAGGSTDSLDIQFLPEGGSGVANVPGSVAFRAVDRNGLPVEVRGRVADDLDTTVAWFKSEHYGMGVFQLTPEKGRSYTAFVRTPYGLRRIPLPPILQDGIVLAIHPYRDGVGIVVLTDTASRYLGRPLKVIGSLYGQLVYKADVRLTAAAPETKGFFHTTRQVPGVLTITVLSEEGEPLAERAVFIRSDSTQIPAVLNLDTLNAGPRGRNVWTLHFPDTIRKYLSVSVTDADAYTSSEDPPSILTGLLFGGDLRGQVYHPGFYFRNDADSTREYLDLVMMTHAWRRFDWKALEQRHFPDVRVRNDKDYLSFDGQLLDAKGIKPVGNTALSVFLKGTDSTKKFFIVPVDSAGHFTLDGLVFFDTASAYCLVNKKGETSPVVRVKLLQQPVIPLDRGDFLQIRPPGAFGDIAFMLRDVQEDSVREQVRRFQQAKELKEIVIRSEKKTVMEDMDKKYASGLFAGGAGYAFDMSQQKESVGDPNVLVFLAARIPGLTILPIAGVTSIDFRHGSAPPKLYVDEMAWGYDALQQLNMSDIAYVKFMMPPFAGGEGGAGGAILVYTYRGQYTSTGNPGLNRLILSGYAPFRQFYTPVYDSRETIREPFGDYRVTLDWAPFLSSTSDTVGVPIRFYNNDACRHFRIVAEGMGEDGRLFHLEQVVDAESKKQ